MMTTDERDSMALACCNTCLLAETMRDCPRCAFSFWRVFKALKNLELTGTQQERVKALKANFIEKMEVYCGRGVYSLDLHEKQSS